MQKMTELAKILGGTLFKRNNHTPALLFIWGEKLNNFSYFIYMDQH